MREKHKILFENLIFVANLLLCCIITCYMQFINKYKDIKDISSNSFTDKNIVLNLEARSLDEHTFREECLAQGGLTWVLHCPIFSHLD